jgi:transcriptional regulator of acetoin/glycerol metabolism
MPPDPWAITLSRKSSSSSEGHTQDCLIRLVTCDRPRAASTRHLLGQIATVTIGRAPATRTSRRERTLDLEIADRQLSREHCTLSREDAGWVLRDRGSKNGTAVNGEPVRDRILVDGDLIETGQTFLLFRERLATSETEPADLDASELQSVTPQLATFDPVLATAYEQLVPIATAGVHVMVLGPSGAGKELVARALHARSERRGPFVAVNCGALPDTLVASELFGSVKGAYSGAADRGGFLRAAQGGTLFLDEIGDLKPAAQPALLRVLQEREVVPVGASRPIPLDIRVICATHRDLPALVAAGVFREDLAARLFGFVIELPALARRRCDLGLLVAALTEKLAPDRELAFSPDVMRRLLLHSWPANVRQLETVLASAIALSQRGSVELHALPEELRSPKERSDLTSEGERRARDELVELLREHGGNLSAMARASGWSRMQLHRRLARYQLDADSFRRRRPRS